MIRLVPAFLVLFLLIGCTGGFGYAARQAAEQCEPVKYEASWKAKRLTVECK